MSKVNTAELEPAVEIVLVRHAQSEWNQKNLFSGWADPRLTENGVAEAEQAGQLLADHGYSFDLAYASRLIRAIQTRDLILSRLPSGTTQLREDWRLNERHYGVLQGLSKTKMAEEVGEDQVMSWRRGYRSIADSLPVNHKDHPVNNPSYKDIAPDRLPGAENLEMTQQRVLEFWRDEITPQLVAHKKVLVSSHGNTLRALIMALSGMSEHDVENFEIPTGTPIIYRFSPASEPLTWKYLSR